MNTRKDRYAVRISESSYIEMQEQALRDGAKQGIAVALVALEKALGWRKIRLERVYGVVDELLHLPQIFGHDVTADDAIAYLRKTYGIDVDQLNVQADAREGVSHDQDQHRTNTANRHDPTGSGSLPVAQGLQTGCLLGCGSGSECDSDILTHALTHAERKPNARER